MTTSDASTPDPSALSRQAEGSGQPARGYVRFLYSQNPFYLLSVSFVLHGTGIWYRANATTHSPWILFGIIASYIVMMAGTGFVIVRRGQVWEDARSILLILFVLFLELAMTADDVLVGDRGTGQAMLLGAWLVAAGVTELLLSGLRIRLRSLYRVPLHLLLALIVLYPLTIVRGAYPHDGERITWAVFLFSPAAALVLLTLVPAIRRGPAYTSRNGTPWAWPYYPWSIFGCLMVVVVLRSYSLCLSFDPVLDIGWVRAQNLENRFGSIYLTPLLLALSVLCLEWTRVSDSVAMRRAALFLPIAAVFTAIPIGAAHETSLYVAFLNEMTSHLASPVWITISLSLVVTGYAMLRRVQHVEISLSVLLVLLAFLSPQATGPSLSVTPTSWPLALASVVQLAVGIRARNSIQVFVGMVCGSAAALCVLPESFGIMSVVAILYLLVVGMIVAGRLLPGRFAGFLFAAGAILLTAGSSLTPVLLVPVVHNLIPQVTQAMVAITMALFTATSIAFWLLTRDAVLRWSAGISAGIAVPAGLLKAALSLLRLPGGRGIVWALGGMLWFALAAWISARKARSQSQLRPEE